MPALPSSFAVIVWLSLILIGVFGICVTEGARLRTRRREYILKLLETPGGWTGLQIVVNSKGLLKRGTVYLTLGRLEKEGLITSTVYTGPAPSAQGQRRYYLADETIRP